MNLIGRYELLEQLGEGSMGRIYRAKDPALDREVALNTLSTAGVQDSELLERFYREAEGPQVGMIPESGRRQDRLPHQPSWDATALFGASASHTVTEGNENVARALLPAVPRLVSAPWRLADF